MYPKYVPVTGQNPNDYFRDLIEAGLKKKYKVETPEIRERIEYELGVITKLGYVEYYLIVWDYINYARNYFIKETCKTFSITIFNISFNNLKCFCKLSFCRITFSY